MKRLFLVIILAMILACGEDETAREDSPVSDEVIVSIMIEDSIGIEIGDSNYVFGAIEGIAFGPDGNIAVLDCLKSCILIYSPDGEFVRSISRKGSGPGEMQDIGFMAISQDGHIYLAGEGSEIVGLHNFDYFSGEWLGSVQSMGTPPTNLAGADGSSYIRKDLDVDMSTGEPIVLVSIARYDFEADEPSVVYFEDSFPFDPTDMAKMVSIVWFGYDVAADFEGNVYIAPRSTEEGVVFAYNMSGEETFRITLDAEPVERTEEELEIERLVLRTKAAIMDMEQVQLAPDRYKPIIRGLEVDGEGNIWVLHGGLVTPTFDVFDRNGEFLFTAELEKDVPDGGTWRFFMNHHGILAYSEDPADYYQKVYVLTVD